MINAKIFILISICASKRLCEPIYYSERVFTFEVNMRKSVKDEYSHTKVYLTTYNEFWPHGNDQKLIKWEDKIIRSTSVKYTGVIESTEEIFIHPPRYDKYAILEFSPFPIVKFPLYVGKTWKWSVVVGEGWAKAAGIKNYKQDTEFNHYYTVTGKSVNKLDNKSIECYVIESVCNSAFGGSKLLAHFNEEFGFVKLDYINMDGSHYIFTLEKIQEIADIKKLDKLINHDYNSFRRSR